MLTARTGAEESMGHDQQSMKLPRVVIVNQYYVPDVASTGQLLDELARGLVTKGFPVRVLTAAPTYAPVESRVECPGREILGGVDVVRMRTTRMSKDRALGRVLNSLTFFGQVMARMLLGSRRDTVYLYATNPPLIGIVGAMVSLVRRHRYVMLLHDAYPQIAVWVGKVKKGGLAERVWEWMNQLTYRRAVASVVLCQAAMRLVCETYGVSAKRVRIVHNWADGEKLNPRPKGLSKFAKGHGLESVFTLMYSGNLGLYYEYETLLGAAERLKEAPFRLVFVGAGGRRTWLTEEIKRRGLTNAMMFGYQPVEHLNDSLAAADALLVTIAKGIEGISFPSKLYSSLALGKPIVAVSEEHSELRGMVEGAGAGLWFCVGDAEGLAEGVRRMIREPAVGEEMGRKARELFERDFTLETSVRKYAEVLKGAGEAQG